MLRTSFGRFLNSRKSFFLAAILLTSLLVPDSARAGTQDLAKLALHATPAVTPATSCLVAPTATPCGSFTTTRPTSDFSTVYLVVANGDPFSGLNGLSCGIDYAGSPGSETGIGIFSWTLCSDGLDFMSGGPNGDWPQAGGGIRITWSTCQTTEVGLEGVHAVAGAFYVYSYGSDVLAITENKTLLSGDELLISDCAGGVSTIP